ncbi:MAG TPA: YcaO-like family protein [Polyangiaceae bacterium]|nr:YcaO-like family protein [Polyangiaceae bacterium]
MSVLSHRTRKLRFAGTLRGRSPSETLAAIESLPSRVGITRVANVTGLDCIGIPNYVAIRPNSRSLSVSQGKGVDHDMARLSALMESIEQHFAETADVPLRRGTYAELRSRYHVVDPFSLPAYARRWTEHTPMLWTTAHEIASGAPVEVPFDLVHANLTLPLPSDSGYFPIGTNGLASGNSVAEALVHGLCELIERDSLALFYASPPADQFSRCLALDSVADPVASWLLERYQLAGIRVAVWDITSDIGVSAFFCSIIDETPDPFRQVGLASGFGCHLDRSVALCRALCEAAQSRLTKITGSRDDISFRDFARNGSHEQMRRARAQLPSAGFRELGSIPNIDFETFEDALGVLGAALTRCGLGPASFVVLSPADAPVSVVRVIVPGLEGVPTVPGYRAGSRVRGLGRACAS